MFDCCIQIKEYNILRKLFMCFSAGNKMTITIEESFKYSILSYKQIKYSFCVRYILWVSVCVFVVLTSTLLLVYSLLLRSNYLRYYDFNKPLEKDQHRAIMYSLSTSVFNEKAVYVNASQVDTANKEKFDKVISCYYNAPTNFSSELELQPKDIHPHLCTHINVAFANVRNKTIHMGDNLKRAVKKVVKLKEANPKLKVLLSIGGSGDKQGFIDMVVNHASRKIFIKSIKSFLKEYKADGVDLDWEFPAVHNIARVMGFPRERQHFSQLLHEIKSEYAREKREYLLTVAAAAPQFIVDNAYDVGQLDLYTDYVNIMTYDFHYYSRFTPFTGLNSPLYPRSRESTYLESLNINSTVSNYISKGLSPDKIVVGVPTYGHSFTLVNSNNPTISSPASGYGSLGSLGFVNYPDICHFIQEYEEEIIINIVSQSKVPYLYRGYEWVSFENQYSVMEKAKFVKHYKLRGAMIYSLNADDYAGKCQVEGDDKFPLSQSIRSALIGDDMKAGTDAINV